MESTLTNEMIRTVEDKKEIYKPALAISILSIVFGFVFALVGDILSIIGIVLSSSKRKSYNTTASLVCSILGLVIGIANHIIAVMLIAPALGF